MVCTELWKCGKEGDKCAISTQPMIDEDLND